MTLAQSVERVVHVHGASNELFKCSPFDLIGVTDFLTQT